jgi:hypothetical protein
MKFPRNELSSQDLLVNILENVLKIPHSIVSPLPGEPINLLFTWKWFD